MNPTSSPTGTPILSPKLIPYLLGLVGLAGVVYSLFPNTVYAQVAAVVMAIGAALGIASPGLRAPVAVLPDTTKASDVGAQAAQAVTDQAKAVDVLNGK